MAANRSWPSSWFYYNSEYLVFLMGIGSLVGSFDRCRFLYGFSVNGLSMCRPLSNTCSVVVRDLCMVGAEWFVYCCCSRVLVNSAVYC